MSRDEIFSKVQTFKYEKHRTPSVILLGLVAYHGIIHEREDYNVTNLVNAKKVYLFGCQVHGCITIDDNDCLIF